MYSKEILPFWEIYEAYIDCRKNKRNTCNALEFELDLEDNLIALWEDILNEDYQIGQSIAFIVNEPRIREIFAADFRDRIVHHLVIRKIEALFEKEFIDDSCNCRKEKGTLYGIKRLSDRINSISLHHPGYKNIYVAKFDLENFFMKIHRPTLCSMLEEFLNKKYHEKDKELIISLVRMIVLHCPEKNCRLRSPEELWKRLDRQKSLFHSGDQWGLPIGNLTSQVFANFLLNEFDHKYLDNRMSGRYVDDFYMIGEKGTILDKISQMEWDLQRKGIRLHRKKKYIQHISKGTVFLGSVCKMGRTYVSNATVTRALEMIKYYNSQQTNINTMYEFVQKLNSYLGYMKHFNSYSIRYRLMKSINRKWFKYIYLGTSINKACVKNKYKKRTILHKKTKSNRGANGLH